MMIWPLILRLLGYFVGAYGVFMAIPGLLGLYGHDAHHQAYFMSASVCVVVAVLLQWPAYLSTADDAAKYLSRRSAFLLTALCWLMMCVLGALPLYLTGATSTLTNALFEATSGLTTTGSTVIVGLDHTPNSTQLWRGMLQYLGGFGFIAMAVAVLPFLRVGGMQIFQMESSDKSEKFLPRVGQVVGILFWTYNGFVVACTFSLWLAGMSMIDAVVHAMATIATGGFSTRDASVAAFNSPVIEWIIITFMFLSGLPFILIARAMRGQLMVLLGDEQVKFYVRVVVAFIVAIVVYRLTQIDFVTQQLTTIVRDVAFAVVSIITSTGFTTVDFSTWGVLPILLFLTMMWIGGCAGSTTGGLKTFRVMMLLVFTRTQLHRLIQPHAVIIPHMNHRSITDEATISVVGFVVAYAVTLVMGAVLLGAMDLDLLTAISGAATALGNTGPGLSAAIGPASNFLGLPDAAKWVLTALMLLGRLELFTLYVLFSRSFWRD